MTPPLPPPRGMSTTEVFQVIQAASARTVSMVSSGCQRIPPLFGPRAQLYWTRYPRKILTLPSSICTGIVTISSFWGQRRSSWVAGSSPSFAAAVSSCCCAMVKGFSSVMRSSSSSVTAPAEQRFARPPLRKPPRHRQGRAHATRRHAPHSMKDYRCDGSESICFRRRTSGQAAPHAHVHNRPRSQAHSYAGVEMLTGV